MFTFAAPLMMHMMSVMSVISAYLPPVLVNMLEAIILGIVQGLTEFIPVSSSGHLIIVPWLLGMENPSLVFDTVLHWGTLIAIFLVFWRDLWAIFVATLNSLMRRSFADPNARLGWYIVVGSIPAVAAGLLLNDFFEELYNDILGTGISLLITAALLVASEQVATRRRPTTDLETLGWGQSIMIGVAQAAALIPGVSRSGSTMAMGLSTGLQRDAAARYSFLLGTPVFFGAALLQLGDALATDAAAVMAQMPEMVVGLTVSAIVGYFAIRGLIAYLRRHSLYIFAAYCVVMGSLVIALSLL